MKRLSAVLIMSLLTTVLWAQTPSGPPSPADRVSREVKFLTTMLGLNSSQQAQATSIFTAAATAQQGLRDADRSAHQNLNTAMKNNDANGIDQAAAAIGQLDGQRLAIESKARAAFQQILSADQQSKLSELRGPHGPGGPGGPGPRFFGHAGGPPPQ